MAPKRKSHKKKAAKNEPAKDTGFKGGLRPDRITKRGQDRLELARHKDSGRQGA
jgi:hypothetical protein